MKLLPEKTENKPPPYAVMIGTCHFCGKIFNFHPCKVPAVKGKKDRCPVCRKCVDQMNTERAKHKLPPIPCDGAYEEVDQ